MPKKSALILGIETSCDETALALIDGPLAGEAREKVLANITLTQTIHQKYGGVFPMLAKREHAKNLIPLLKAVLTESGFLKLKIKNQNEKKLKHYSDILENIRMTLNREPVLWKEFQEFIPTIEKPPIDAIAVTEGPGLEPALWVGINFAKALASVWNIPIIPINHMEGHIVSALFDKTVPIREDSNRGSSILLRKIGINFPTIALLISGGHTELVLMKDWFDYEIIGATKDDAVGEAFDKVARILGLPYPGGPEISRLTEVARLPDFAKQNRGSSIFVNKNRDKLPRPMLNSGDLNFSFSGLKTAVLYLAKKMGKLSDDDKKNIACEFEDAVTEVLVAKTKKALEQFNAKTLIIGGGVSANKNIRAVFENFAEQNNVKLFIASRELATDNALMIAFAGMLRLRAGKTKNGEKITAQGNLKIDG